MDQTPIADRIAAFDWTAAAAELDAQGAVRLGPLLTGAECAGLAAGWDDAAAFRQRIVMARHGFGSGEYRYYAAPLPPPVAALRRALYPRLATVARAWQPAEAFPRDLDEYLARCHAAGQTRPTPLLLRYEAGDYNCLHQDIYGALAFLLQVVVLLSRPGEDFTGGEFVLTEQRPRRQSRAEVVTMAQGEAVAFAVRHRPVRGARGPGRVAMRHGVSRVRSGRRFTLGVIFHDAA